MTIPRDAALPEVTVTLLTLSFSKPENMSEEHYLELCESPVQFENASAVNNVFFDEANKQVPCVCVKTARVSLFCINCSWFAVGTAMTNRIQ